MTRPTLPLLALLCVVVAANGQQTESITIAVPKANIRKSPDKNSPIVASAYMGDVLKLALEKSKNGFYTAEYDERKYGWVHETTIETESAVEIVSKAEDDARKSYLVVRGQYWHW